MARLSPAQRVLLEQRLLEVRKSRGTADQIPKAPPGGEYPLTHVQRRVWAYEQMRPGTAVYNVIWVKSLHGALHLDALQQAFAAIVARHAMLRAVFRNTPDGPVQRILPQSVATVEYLSVEPGAGDRLGRAEELAIADGARVFDLEHGPVARATVIRLAEHEHWLLLAMHHLVSDGWTMGMVERELAELYEAFTAGRAANLPPVEMDYTDFAAWQSPREPDDAYWVDELEGAPPELGLLTDFVRPVNPMADAWRGRVLVPAHLLDGLEAVARETGATVYAILVAAWAIVLHRHCCGEEIMIGTPLAGRSRPELSGVAGFFANTLPLRVSLHGDPPFDQLVARVKQKVLAAVGHQDGAFDLAVERAKTPRSAGMSPGFQAVVAYLESPPSPSSFGGLRTGHVVVDHRFAHFDVMLFAGQFAGQLELSVCMRKQLFREGTCAGITGQFERLLYGIASNPRQPLSHYSLMDAAGRAAVLSLGTRTGPAVPREPVHVLFEQQAAQTPQRIALVERDRNVTYAELSKVSDRVAAAVALSGAGPGAIVAVLCDGSAAMVAAFLGVMKAGAAYLPLDAADPRERLASLIEQAGVKLVLTSGDEQFAGAVTLPLQPDENGSTIAPRAVLPDSPAYVMYTSGSTGVPKAVVVPHRGVARLVKDGGFARLDHSSVLLHMAPPAFDASTFEIWAPLLNGGCCVLYSGRRAALTEIGKAIRRHKVNTLWLTSSLFNAVIDESPEILAPIGQLLIGGEALSVRHVTKALRALPDTKIINGYGPTECTTFACTYLIPRDLDANSASVPIGTPIGNTSAYILDARGEPVPVGVPGELCLGGDGVALGFLNQPALTGELFVRDPFRAGEHRMYRTGDRARWLPSGAIEFLGRADAQVKIRGFRVEPGEVEAALGAIPGVAQCAVAVQDDPAGVKQLAAYVVPARGQTGELDSEAIRHALGERLPSYMIPARIAMVDHLPLRENGKVDRALLPQIERAHSVSEAPRDEIERGLLELWRELLGTPDAGVTDEFFRLGGDSLRALRLAARIDKLFGQNLPLATIIAAPTVRKLAAVLRSPNRDPGFVVVTPGSSRCPLVWVDPGRGLRHLADALGPGQPLHSLTLTPDELAELPQPYRLEDLAGRLADKLERQRPGGPTILASFCLRTFLAVETARALRDRGHHVPLVVLADPSDPETAGHLLNPAGPGALAWRTAVNLRKLRTVPVREWGVVLGRLSRGLIRRVQRQYGGSLILDRPILAAGARHRFAPYDGALLLVRIAEEEALRDDNIVRSWKRIAAGRLEVRSLSGGHVDLFDPPHVSDLAQLLKEEISAVLRNGVAH